MREGRERGREGGGGRGVALVWKRSRRREVENQDKRNCRAERTLAMDQFRDWEVCMT